MAQTDIRANSGTARRRRPRGRGWAGVLTGMTATAVLAVTPVASAATGDLDHSFGPAHDGTVLTDIGAGGSAIGAAVARQADGKIVVVGAAADHDLRKLTVARYNADGGLDSGFGTGGTVLTPIGKGKSAQANGVVVQPDGKILAVGGAVDEGESKFTLARYTAAGALDTTFGTGGIVLTSFGTGSNASASAVAVQPDGAIVASGGVVPTNGQAAFALARYTTAGALDTTFGTGGIVSTAAPNLAGPATAASAVVIAPDGKIVTAGATGSSSQSAVALVRYTGAGALDTTFGTGGAVVTSIGSAANAVAGSLVLTPAGGIVTAGMAQDKGALKFALTAYTPTGAPDPAFGPGGGTLIQVGDGGSAAATKLIRQADGKLVAIGTALDGGKRKFAVLRISATGAPDGSFGSGGSALTAFGIGAFATSAVLQPDGKLVAAGSAGDSSGLKFALARYDLGAGSAS